MGLKIVPRITNTKSKSTPKLLIFRSPIFGVEVGFCVDLIPTFMPSKVVLVQHYVVPPLAELVGTIIRSLSLKNQE